MEHETYEVVFRKYHVMHFPWGPNNEVVEHLKGYPNVPLQDEVIQVRRLCHVTHEEQARLIISEDHEFYTFIPKQKMGRPAGEDRQTYAIREPMQEAPNGQTGYQRILGGEEVFPGGEEVLPEDKEVFPGFYVWWSVAVDDDQTIHWRDMYFNEAGKYYITDGFRKPTQSVYGNKMFIVDFNTMLQCYQEAFVEQPSLPRILLRCGGTLRYKREIMKVIIVCREEDLPEYPVFTTDEFYLEYDCYDNRKVTPRGILKLCVKNGVSGSQQPRAQFNEFRRYYSWDTYSFAFYFPGGDYRMRYPKVFTVKHNYVNNDTTFATCHSKVNGICPNDN